MQTHGRVRNEYMMEAYSICPAISWPDPLSSTSRKCETAKETFKQTIFKFIRLNRNLEKRAQ